MNGELKHWKLGDTLNHPLKMNQLHHPAEQRNTQKNILRRPNQRIP